MQEKERQRQQERQQRLGAPGEQLSKQFVRSLRMLQSWQRCGTSNGSKQQQLDAHCVISLVYCCRLCAAHEQLPVNPLAESEFSHTLCLSGVLPVQ
jgi:hypothetical protein